MAGKRAHGEGYITQTPNGKWRGQLMDGNDPITGKRIIISFTAPTKREVLQKIQNYKLEKEQKKKAPPMTFSQWADRWYEDYRTQVEPSTYSNYKYTLQDLKDHFGKAELMAIRPMDINDYLTGLLRKGFSHSKISKCRAMLIQILDSALVNGLLDRNPARAAKAIRAESVTGELVPAPKDAFTPEEVERLMEDLPDDAIGNAIRLLLGSGMRIQELVALTAADIAEDGSWVDINKAVKMVDGKPVLGPPKSRRGIRTIPIPLRFRPYAVDLRKRAGKLFVLRAKKLLGTPCTIESFRKRYYGAIKQVPGVRALTPHCCRHTYITMLQAKGVPMETIARLVGHSRVTTTDGYLHIQNAALEKAVAVLDVSDTREEAAPA
ncbi:tyrosine-type recombinase/integrase [uncultured Flavonifractor sp.]|uniref:tyrosine-type recombinase/integrase n=1 Tax=uncultured Flavonifractor sp. TaxID=1193534 RepID=UPI002611BEEA|nr:site-specific integrase [uncultured Flavonifractor sp.]